MKALIVSALSASLFIGGAVTLPTPAQADTATTAAIIAGAAAITGALIYDSSNHPYYIRNNRRYYVTSQEVQYYRGHHSGTVTRRETQNDRRFPVARDPYHGNAGRQMQGRHDDGHSHR